MDLYNILVVDNEVINLNALVRTLRSEYNVFSATNSEDAMSIMEREDIALVITDHRISNTTGVGFLEKISQKYPCTSRMILTEHIDEKSLIEAISIGVVHNGILKPWEPEEVRNIVKEGVEFYKMARDNRELYNQTSWDSGTVSKEQLDDDFPGLGMEKKMVGGDRIEYNMTSGIQRIKALEKVLNDPDEGVRQKVAESLSRIEAIVDLDNQIRMLDSDDRTIRIQTVYLLAEIATEASVQLLWLQVKDPYDDVRAAIIRALGDNSDNFRDPEVRKKAVDIALIGLEDMNLSIRTSAADTLAKFKDPRSVEALMKVIDGDIDEESENIQLAVSVLLALGEIGNREIVPKIIEKVKVDNVDVKEAALKILGMLGDPRAEKCLIEALTSDNVRIRTQAAESLGKI